MNKKVEVLAPAGSVESMIAAINAGADAVYMGGSRFGARAYADNPEEERYLEAIDYAHLHGCRLYMTVNTLVKESEFDQLYDYLKPYYERGLDAVIVQDMGVFTFIREVFPDLPVHASTQMTVTSYRYAKELKRLGAARVVTARELSLEEIRNIHKEVDIEIESFVHGALCYCYSGQCLLSSLIGGRSGNRGRCAQPCRLPYELLTSQIGKQEKKTDYRQDKRLKEKDKNHQYLLSMKDLNTLDILPDIIEAGVYSLKIEGRMKSPRYTAGVVSIYRKYVDLYLEKGRDGYRVDPADKKLLLDLFDRGGQTEGYYRRHNGRDMIALKEKPAFREVNQELFDRLDREYVDIRKQEPICGYLRIHEGEAAELTLITTDGAFHVQVQGDIVSSAQNQPLTEEKLLKQMKKTGNTPFWFESLQCSLEGKCFLPVQGLNELRRKGMECLQEEILSAERRTAVSKKEALERMEKWSQEGAAIREAQTLPEMETSGKEESAKYSGQRYQLHVSLEEPEGFPAALSEPDVLCIGLDSVGFGAEQWKSCVDRCHEFGKTCSLILPQIFRTEAAAYFTKYEKELKEAGFDSFLLRSMEEVGFLKELGLSHIPMIFDSNLYTMNETSAEFMLREGAKRLTLPLECNSRELEEVGAEGKELIVYGYLPAMVSAQCITKTTAGCRKIPGLCHMKDRTGKELPVKNHCRFCYNTIYNPSPLSLFGQEKVVEKLAPKVLRLQFTMETPDQIHELIRTCAESFLYGREVPVPLRDYTRGHMKRGVE